MPCCREFEISGHFELGRLAGLLLSSHDASCLAKPFRSMAALDRPLDSEPQEDSSIVLAPCSAGWLNMLFEHQLRPIHVLLRINIKSGADRPWVTPSARWAACWAPAART